MKILMRLKIIESIKFENFLVNNSTQARASNKRLRGVAHLRTKQGTVVGITQPSLKDGARNALFSNLSKSGLDNYVVKRSKCHLLEEVA